MLRENRFFWWSAAFAGATALAQAAGCGGVDTAGLFGTGGGASSTGAGLGGATSSGSQVTSSSNTGGAGATSSSVSGSGGAGVTSSVVTGPSTSVSATSSATGPAICGDGTVELGEACDGADFGGQTCKMFGFVNPAGLVCLPDCSAVDPSGCKAQCNNGVREPGEQCDGNDFGSATCNEYGFKNPNGLKCDAVCTIDASNCKAVCGNGVVEPGEQCDDGNKVSGDGCSSTCQAEGTPDGTTCASAIPVDLALGTTPLSGTTVGGGQHSPQSCQADGTDRIYAVKPQADGYLTAYLPRSKTGFDSVLYAANACQDAAFTEFLCNDTYDTTNNQSLNGGEILSFHVKAGNTYYVVVDAFDANTAGPYTLLLDLSVGNSCADPVPLVIEPGAPQTILGTNSNVALGTQGSCGGAPAGEVVYQIMRTANGPVRVETDLTLTNFNAVLYDRSTCSSTQTELACSNQGGPTVVESVTPSFTGSTPIFVFVDGSQIGGGNASGNYGLVLTP